MFMLLTVLFWGGGFRGFVVGAGGWASLFCCCDVERWPVPEDVGPGSVGDPPPIVLIGASWSRAWFSSWCFFFLGECFTPAIRWKSTPGSSTNVSSRCPVWRGISGILCKWSHGISLIINYFKCNFQGEKLWTFDNSRAKKRVEMQISQKFFHTIRSNKYWNFKE